MSAGLPNQQEKTSPKLSEVSDPRTRPDRTNNGLVFFYVLVLHSLRQIFFIDMELNLLHN